MSSAGMQRISANDSITVRPTSAKTQPTRELNMLAVHYPDALPSPNVEAAMISPHCLAQADKGQSASSPLNNYKHDAEADLKVAPDPQHQARHWT